MAKHRSAGSAPARLIRVRAVHRRSWSVHPDVPLAVRNALGASENPETEVSPLAIEMDL